MPRLPHDQIRCGQGHLDRQIGPAACLQIIGNTEVAKFYLVYAHSPNPGEESLLLSQNVARSWIERFARDSDETRDPPWFPWITHKAGPFLFSIGDYIQPRQLLFFDCQFDCFVYQPVEGVTRYHPF